MVGLISVVYFFKQQDSCTISFGHGKITRSFFRHEGRIRFLSVDFYYFTSSKNEKIYEEAQRPKLFNLYSNAYFHGMI